MSSGKKNQQVYQQQAAPSYGAQQSTQSFTPWGQAQPGYDAIAAQMAAMAAQGPQWATPSGQTQAAMGSLVGAGETALRNYNFLSSAADVANNPYVQNMAKSNEQQVNQNLQRNLLPGLQNAGVGGGGLGSSRLGLAQGQALGDTSKSLANTNAQMMLGAYSQGLGAQQQALSSLGSLQQGLLLPGQVSESYNQGRLNAPWQFMQNMGAATQYLSPLGTQTGNSQTGPAGTSFGAQGAAPPGYGAPPAGAPPNYLQGYTTGYMAPGTTGKAPGQSYGGGG
jgi:hypothetical protein